MTIIERQILEGTLCHISVSTDDGSTTEKIFSFESDDIDINGDGVDESTPLKNKMLFITGIDIQNDSGNNLDYLIFDNGVVYDGKVAGTSAGDRIQINGEQVTWGSSGNAPKIKDVFGIEYIPCRNFIKIKASESSGGKTTVIIHGIYVDCKF